MEVINGPKGYVVILGGVPHTVDKATKLCDCKGGCLAPSYVERYFNARRAHLCPICASETRPHRFISNANICVSDPTHYWKVVAGQNRIHWNNLAKDAQLIGVDAREYIRRCVLSGRRPRGQQNESIPQAGIDEGGEVQPNLPPMPEASQPAS